MPRLSDIGATNRDKEVDSLVRRWRRAGCRLEPSSDSSRRRLLSASRAREVSVDLTCSLEALALTIVDDGVGFDVKAGWGKGLGLISMRERLEAVGGTLQVRSSPGSRTRLEVRASHHADQSM